MRPAHRRVLQARQQSISLGDDADASRDSADTAPASTGPATDEETSATSDPATTAPSTTPITSDTTSVPPVTISTPSTTSTPTTSESSTEEETSSTPTTSSTLSSTSSTSSSSVETSSTPTTSSESLTTSALVRDSSTSFVTNVVTVGPSSTLSSAASTSSSSGSSGPGAGAVVGVVAGALVGVVVIAGLLGYFFKTKFGKKDEDLDDIAFNKDDFRHNSVMLHDDDDRLSMRSGSVAGSLGAARNLPGLQRNDTSAPRPPSMFERHVYNASPVEQQFAQPPMPSFQPGQIVNSNFYNQQPTNNYSEGGWGAAAAYGGYQNQNHLSPTYNSALDRQNSVSSHYEDQGMNLNRQPSYASALDYGRAAEHDYPPQNGRISPQPQQQYYQGHDGAAQRQLSVRNQQGDRDSAGYDGMGF